MKILHLNSYYISDFFYDNLFEEQRKMGHSLDIFVHKHKKQVNKTAKNSIIVSPYRKFHRFTFNRKHYLIGKEMNKVITDTYDLIHAHSLFSNGYDAYNLFLRTNTPYIVAVRSTDLNVFFKYFIHLRKKGIKVLKNAKSIIFISTACRDDLFNKYIPQCLKDELLAKSHVITNGVSNFWIENAKSTVKDSNKISVIHVGKINKNKNAIVICKALEKIKQRGYDVQLKCFGKIESKRVINKILKYDFVQHINFLSKEELILEYCSSNIFVLLSKTETFGISYLEAMSQGLPLIYTKGQGFDNQYEDGIIGFSNIYNDVDSLVEKIIYLTDDKKAYSKISANSILKVYDFEWKNITSKYDEIYLNIMRNKDGV